MNNKGVFPPGFGRAGQIGTGLGVLGAIGLFGALVVLHDIKLFWQAYLFGWMFWMCFTLGCLGFLLLQTMCRAKWGRPIVRLLEAGAKTLPVLFVLFLPILIWGLPYLYAWADPTQMRLGFPDDPVLKHRSGFMNPTWFAIRSLFYFAIFGMFTAVLTRYSRLQDHASPDRIEDIEQFRVNMASAGTVIHIITVTFAFTDWAMSLEKHWYSTIYGGLFLVYQSLAAMALCTYIVNRNFAAGQAPYTEEVVTIEARRDWGNLLLTLVMVWAYFSLSQWLITWSGNLPQEIIFYYHRFRGAWLYIGSVLIAFQFFAPFLMLLSGKTKRYPGLLITVSTYLLILRVIDMCWQILPVFVNSSVFLVPISLISLIGFGGVWFAFFARLVTQEPLLEIHPLTPFQEVRHHA